jgi:hypothetical protein
MIRVFRSLAQELGCAADHQASNEDSDDAVNERGK